MREWRNGVVCKERDELYDIVVSQMIWQLVLKAENGSRASLNAT
jgi:hypothetical protein